MSSQRESAESLCLRDSALLTCSRFSRTVIQAVRQRLPVGKSLNELVEAIGHRQRKGGGGAAGSKQATHAKGTFYCANTLSTFPACSLQSQSGVNTLESPGPVSELLLSPPVLPPAPLSAILSRPKHSFLLCHCMSRLHPSSSPSVRFCFQSASLSSLIFPSRKHTNTCSFHGLCFPTPMFLHRQKTQTP